MKHLGGGYLNNIHCHFCLVGGDIGGFSAPLTDEFKQCEPFCVDGQYRDYYDRNRNNYKLPFYYKTVLKELQAQYDLFRRITRNEANNGHIDFHLWQNLFIPVAKAYGSFINNNDIVSARYIGQHHLCEAKARKYLPHNIFAQLCSFTFNVKRIKSCNIDYFISKPELFRNDEIVELYCHPDYVNGELIDNSVSVFGHPKMKLEDHINEIFETVDQCELISWAVIK